MAFKRDAIQNTGTAKTFERLGILVFLPNLRQMQGIPESVLNVLRHGHQVFSAGSDPVQQFGWNWHSAIMPI